MIYVERSKYDRPPILDSDEIKHLTEQMEEFYSIPFEGRSQQRYDNHGFWEKNSYYVLEYLASVFNRKCAYCEMPISPGQLDHFRPQNSTRGLEEDFAPDHYWWLSYTWENMYPACPTCQRNKANWFPVFGDRAEARSPYELILETEKPVLLDPCYDDPATHLWYDEEGNARPNSDRGEATVEILRLNRPDLTEQRMKAVFEEYDRLKFFENFDANRSKKGGFDEVKSVLADWINILNGNSERAFLGIRRFMIRRWMSEDLELYKKISTSEFNEILNLGESETKSRKASKMKGITDAPEEVTAAREIVLEETADFESSIDLSSIRHVHLDKLEFKNYKCFDELKIDFVNDPITKPSDRIQAPWLVFLGENGVGKSSILKALTLCLCDKDYLETILPMSGDLLKYGAKKGYVKLYTQDRKEPVEIQFDDQGAFEIKNPLEPTYLLGYGSVRLLPDDRVKPEDHDGLIRVHNLFKNSVSLVDAKKWLLSQSDEHFDLIARSLKDLLNLHGKGKLYRENREIFIQEGENNQLQLRDLSDGYKSVLAICVDIMSTLQREKITYNIAEGIVLIDEIGTHLHPRWKMKVVESFRRTFPLMQFVVSTHEPLCLRGLKHGEIVVVDKADGTIRVHTDVPDASALRIDQILTSRLFGLNSVVDPENEKLFEKYYALLAIPEGERTSDDNKNIVQLSSQVERIKQLGNTPREEMATFVIDELLAKNARLAKPKDLKVLREEAKERIKTLWNSLEPNEE